ncbi:MAG: hypothetical protein GX076_02170 [Clostridiales bacterium]|nr:hypothetical protein [Clostridiales bacterium]
MKIHMINKKGAVLAYVLIIGAALLILAGLTVVFANSSISKADRGIKSREAYLNAKSGIEYAKVIAKEAKAQIESQLMAFPESITSLPDREYFYAYYDPSDGFVKKSGSPNNDAKFKNSTIQLTYEINHQVTEIPPINEEDEPSYDYNMVINFTSVGRSSKASKLFDNRNILKYQIEPLKGKVEFGVDEPGEGQVIVSENAAFDANISCDVSCYFKNGNLSSFNHGSSYAENHSIVYSKTVTGMGDNLILRANKIYFLGSPTMNINGSNLGGTATLYSNYIYFKDDMLIKGIENPFRIEFKPLSYSSCIVFFDNTTITVSYYDDSNHLQTVSRNLNGFYRFDDYLFDYKDGSLSWADFESLRERGSIATLLEKYDPYIISPNQLGISQIKSGRFEGWSVDNGNLNTSNANSFSPSLSLLYPDDSNKKSDLLIVFANNLNNIDGDSPLVLEAKQIRLVSGMSDYNPDSLSFDNNKRVVIRTDMLSYYGGDIVNTGTSNSLIIESLSGQEAVPIYFERETVIGNNRFTAGYFLLTSGTDLLEEVKNIDLIEQNEIGDEKTELELYNETIVFSGDVLTFGKLVDIKANGPICITIDANRLDFKGQGAVGSNTGELTLIPSDDSPITLYVVRDVIVTLRKKDDIVYSYLIKAGFYSIRSTLRFGDLEGSSEGAPDPPPGVPPETFEGITLQPGAKNYDSTPIAPIFPAPGVPVPYSSFVPDPNLEMKGIYK